MYAKKLSSELDGLIVATSMNSDFIRNPLTDFTRERKLGFTTVFNTVLTMGGNSLDYEMLELFNYKQITPTASAFIQARSKILPSAFGYVFREFTKKLRKPKKYRGYDLLSVDGSSLITFRDPNDLETYVTNRTHIGHNELVLTAMYDLMNNVYTDVITQPITRKDERGALIDMLPNISNKSIIILDRGYESYNVFAHIENIHSKYVMRVKDINSNGILSGFKFPDEEFDKTLTVHITNSQKKIYKSLPNFRFSPSISRFDFSDDDNPVYSLTFRIVRFKLDSGKFQCIITNLFNGFSSKDIAHLYQLRWGIETSFRQLKYAVGLNNFHSKKKDSIIQEIYAKLILHNFCESVVQNEVLVNRATTHNYKINFTRAVQICRKYLRFFNTIFINIEALISKYLSIVRKNRSFDRNIKRKSFTSFIYRVS